MNMIFKGAGARRIGLAIAATAALSFGGAAQAGVVAGDAFTFSIAGFNSASGSGYILGSGLTAVFGETTTFAGAGYNGQAYTISSWEVVGATTTTDYFKISTPTNFLTTTTVNGLTITALQFDIGTANSGVGVATGANPVNFTSALTNYSATGYIVYGANNTVFNLTPNLVVNNGALSFTVAEGVNTGTSAISSIGIKEFNIAITYANPVPEPETWAMLVAGLGVLGVAVRRSRKTAQA